MIKLVAFDWNGTILDETVAAVKAECKVLRHYGHKDTNLREFRDTFTIPIKNYWMAMGLDPNFFRENHKEIQKS